MYNRNKNKMNRRDRQRKDSELFTFIGFAGIIVCVITMWVMTFTMGC